MNTKLLRQKILDLAIRGKLTDQRKSDGTARELLEQISASRHPEQNAKSAKSKDSTPIIPLNKNEAPFEIPDNWEWVKLGDVGKTITGATPSKNHPEYEGDEIPFLSPGDISQANTITSYESQGLSKQGKILARPVPANTVLQVCIGGSIGKCAIVDREVCFNQQINSISVLIAKYEYIYAVLQSLYFQNEIILRATGTATPIINKSSWDNILVPLPPLAEQQRIVAKIEEAFAEIDAVEKNRGLLKTHIKQTRQKILDLAIHGKLVPQNENDEPASILLEKIRQEKAQTDNKKPLKKTGDIATSDNRPYEKIEDVPFEIPENWMWVRINDIALDMADGPFGSNLKAEHYTEKKEARIIQLSNIAENGWRDENVRYTTFEHAQKNISRSVVKAGNLVIAKMMPAGRTMICPSLEKMYVLSSDAVKLVPIDQINKKYLCYSMNSPYFREQVNGNIQGTTRLRTSISKLKECLLAFPPLNEQSRIVSKIEELFSTLDQMERNLI